MVNFLYLLCVLSAVIQSGQGVEDTDKTVLKADLPHIGCDVCMKAMTEIHYITEAARRNVTYGKLTEETIIDLIDKVCAARSKDGIWMRTLDIVEYKEDGQKYLKLNAPGGMSTCGRECGTIEKSCINLFDEEIDRDELTVYIWQNAYKSAEELQVSCTCQYERV